MLSRCHLHYLVYRDSYLRNVCVPADSLSSPPSPNPTWRFFHDHAIPFGDSASSNYATCAKVANVQTFIGDAPPSTSCPLSCAGRHLHQ